MKLEGAQVIAADRMAVWNAINDPEILKQCISGCEEMNKTSATQYDAIVKQKVGPVSATFKGVVNLSDVVEGHSLRLTGDGKGGVAGMAKGGALVTLTDVEGGTQLSYDAEASVAGKLAQLGSRLIDGVAQKMINSFFSNFKDAVESGSGGAAYAGTAQAGTVSSDAGASVSASAGGPEAISGGAAMAGAAGAVGAASANASVYASETAQSARSNIDAHTGALHDAAADRMLNPAIGTGAGDIDMDDPDIGDIDVSSVDGGPSEGQVSADFAAARAAGSQGADGVTSDVAGNLSTMSGSFDPDAAVGQVRDHVGATGDDVRAAAGQAGDDARAAVDRVGDRVAATASDVQAQGSALGDQAVDASRTAMDGARDTVGDTARDLSASASAASSSADGSSASASSGGGISGAGMAAGAAAAGGIGAAVSGFAARAQDTFDGAHDSARERVIAAGGDVDEAKSWDDTKNHLTRAASETRDSAQDVYDAARARVEGDTERASAEWNDAKTNASEAYTELKGGAEDAWTTGKGYAAEEAKAPRIGPLGQPWYLWIIGIIVLLLILWIL